MRGNTQNSALQQQIATSGQPASPEPRAEDGSEPFVGRDGLLASLDGLFQSSAGVNRTVVLSGEAGVGKTRIARAVAVCAREHGFRVAWGHCYGVTEAPAYLPFLQVFEELGLAVVPTEDARLAAGASEAGGGELDRLVRDPSEDRARFVIHVARQLLNEAARQQVLVVVEDIHLADVGSLLLLNHLVDMGGRGLVLFCTRRDEDERQDAAMSQLLFMLERKSMFLQLPGLGRTAVRQLVHRLWGPSVGTGEEMETLRSFTRGNPLFINELMAHLHDSGLLSRLGLRDALAESTIPPRLAGAIELRLGALPAAIRGVLETASVLGEEFRLADFEVVLNTGTGEAADLVFEAMRGGILDTADGPQGPTFRFAHPLYAKHLYESLAPSRRKSFHARLAEVAGRGELHLPVEETARHHALGCNRSQMEKAVELCSEAAENAHRVLAYETEARFWKLAVQCAGDRSPRERAEITSRLGWAYWSSRRWGQAREAWEQGVVLFEGLGESGRVGQLALLLGETARWQQDLKAAAHWLRRAVTELGAESQAGNRAVALLGNVACVLNQTAQGLSLLRRAHEHTVSMGRPDPYVLDCLAFGYMAVGDVERARIVAREGLQLAVDAGNRRAGGLLAGLLVQAELSLLRFADAGESAALCRQLASPADTTGLMFALVSECFLMAYRGNWAGVARVCERGMAELRLAGRYQLSTLRLMRAEAILALGDPVVASQEMVGALPGLEAMRPAGAMHLARALLKLGATDWVRELLSSYAPSLTSTRRMAAAHAVLGEIASHVRDEALCQAMYQALSEEERPLLLLYSPISTQRVLGRLATSLGEWERAKDHFETAITQMSRAAARWEVIQTHLDYAEMRRARRRRGDVRKALALEAEAEQLLAEVGIPPSALGRSWPGPEAEAQFNRFALTGREVEVLQRLAEGERNVEIAEALGISHRTVDRHLENIFSKMGVRGRVDAVLLGVQEGLVGSGGTGPST